MNFFLNLNLKVYLGGSQFILNGTETKEINQPKDTFYLFANLPVSVIALVVNTWAIVIIRKKEKNGIHHLIVCDCVANIISFSHGAWRCNSLERKIFMFFFQLLSFSQPISVAFNLLR